MPVFAFPLATNPGLVWFPGSRYSGYSQSYGQQSSVDGTTAPSPHEQDPYAQSYGRRSRQSSVSSASGIDTAA